MERAINCHSEKKRIEELDWLKCICVLLMVAFHLTLIERMYPDAKNIVFVFHMPVFLIISGYVTNTEKDTKTFLTQMTTLAVPYIIMESSYIVAASLLPINEHINCLTIRTFLDVLLCHPIGPYWFLQTLVICRITVFMFNKIHWMKNIDILIIYGLAFWGISRLGLMSFTASAFFLVGIAIKSSNIHFLRFFQPSVMAIIAIVFMLLFAPAIDKSAPSGLMFIYLTICFLLSLYRFVNGKVKQVALYIGRNTLAILLFSPIFTFIAKYYQPFIICFDSTGVLFLVLSVAIATVGSLAINQVMITMHQSLSINILYHHQN